jgi:8-hydroxy-5-deazaflavin:NADPH oxidoreductase
MGNIAIIGTGKVGTVLAAKLANAGHNVILGTRDKAQAQEKWKGPRVAISGTAHAIEQADIVFNTTPGETSVEQLGALREELRGKVLVDVSNAVKRDANGKPNGLMYTGKSLAEHLQEALPETAVVKTLNTMLFLAMTNPQLLKTPATVFLSGNDTDAKSLVGGLLGDLGWEASSIEDLGDIATARGPEAFMLFVPHIVRNHGFVPFALSVAH